MSATVFCPPESLIEEYPKSGKQNNSRGYSLQSSTQQQSALNHQLPSIFLGMPAGLLSQAKVEENSQALNYFNNPIPVYYQTQTRRENEQSGLLLGMCSSTSSVPSHKNYLSQAIPVQNAFGPTHNVFASIPLKVVKKVQKPRKNSDKCTCKRLENHIPRPRNAFILFRQKHHQSVLKESTNLKTNPEVSRELARRWRALSKEERDHWNSLADDEKKNHAEKYPNYRYQPRRQKKSSLCPICQVKQIERPPTPQHNFAMFTDYHQMMMAQDPKPLKLPITLLGPQQHLQLQQHQHLQHQQQHQHLQHQQQQQQQQQIQQVENTFLSPRYMNYGNYHQQNQYGFSDGISNLSHGIQLLLLPLQTNQQLSQQLYLLLLLLSNTQHHQQQGQTLAQGYSSVQTQQLPVQLQQQLQNTSQTSQGLVGAQFHVFADKYHESAVGYQYQDQAGQGQKYNGLPVPMANNIYNGHDSFTVPALLQLY